MKPIGKTQENVKSILTKDEEKAKNYKEVKKIIDEYHKGFIERVLSGFQLNGKNDSLEDYIALYRISNKTEKEKINFNSVQENLRKQIVLAFEKDEKYETLFKKELITKDLPEFLKDNEEKKALVTEFDKFTTYFTGFYENRKNMYSSEAKSTAIAYRLINENLPKFVDNIKVFENIKSHISDGIQAIYNEYCTQKLVDIKSIDEIFSLNYFNNILGSLVKPCVD